MSNLKQIRESLNISQSELAEKSGVSVRMIQYYEQGVKDINKAQAITVYKLSEALECSVEDLLEGQSENYGEWVAIGNWLLACSHCDNVVEDQDTDEYLPYCPYCTKKMKPGKVHE